MNKALFEMFERIGKSVNERDARIAELEAALREIKTRTYAYRGDDQNFPLAAGVYEVASHALQKSK